MFIDRTIDIIEESILRYDRSLLELLLYDQTSHKNILWATDDYKDLGSKYTADKTIEIDLITGDNTMLIQPRIAKNEDTRIMRTRQKAEVFTPSWVCNKQNNLVDDAWFGKKNVFNHTRGTSWKGTTGNIEFPNTKGKTWKDYTDARRMEVSCGEAPYLTSRYDTVSGKKIDNLNDRIGMLDRKLRVVNENCTEDKKTWFEWVKRAYQSIYGFEYCGDSLLLARESLLATFWDNHIFQWGKNPGRRELLQIANIISWNIWQMDAFTYSIPGSGDNGWWGQGSMFDDEQDMRCYIKDWRGQKKVLFAAVAEGGKK